MTDTIKIPEVIYLQWYGDVKSDGGEVTWSDEVIYDDDVKYVLANEDGITAQKIIDDVEKILRNGGSSYAALCAIEEYKRAENEQ